MIVIWLDAAQEQLEDIHNFTAQKSLQAAADTYNDIIDEADKLAGLPEMAALEPSLREEANSYRALIVQRTYKVIYRVNFESEEVIVTSVWDCRQDPEALVKKTTKKK